jgi:hypothetical protein
MLTMTVAVAVRFTVRLTEKIVTSPNLSISQGPNIRKTGFHYVN